jgi:nitrous oxidase accessory protein
MLYWGVYMKNKSIIWFIILIFLVSNFIPIISSYRTTSNNIIYVDDDGGADYTSIQDAIDNASDRDTIFVYNGIYYEYLQINKSIDLIGDNNKKTIVDGKGRGDVICLKSSDINILNFTIRNASIDDGHYRGIFQRYDPENNYPHVENIVIKDCIITNNGRGMTLDSISNLLIENCEIFANPSCSILFGIFAENYTINNISINNCTFRDNGINLPVMGNKSGGIQFFGNGVNCSDISISNCLFVNSILFGIYIERSNNIEVSNNVIMGSTRFGIWLNTIENLEVFNNSVTKSGIMGIGLSNVKNANVKYNNVFENGFGEFWNGGLLIQHYSENITIKNNNFKDNNEYGLLILSINQSLIFENNFINNIKNLHFIQSQPYNIILDNNYWGRNRILPYLILGLDENYWFIPRIMIDWHPATEPYDISC